MRKSRTRKGTRGGMGAATPATAPYAPAPVKAAAPRTPASTAPAKAPATAPRTPAKAPATAPYAPAPYAPAKAPAQNNIAGTMEKHARNAGSRVATAARRIFSDWLGGSRTKRRGGTKKRRRGGTKKRRRGGTKKRHVKTTR